MSIRKCYLVSANTSEGFVSFYSSMIKQMERVYVLKGGPGSGKSTFIKRTGEELLEFGYDVDFLYCSFDADSVDGIIIHDIDTAIVDGTAPNVIEPEYPGAIERILNFGDYWDIDYLRKNKSSIKNIFDSISGDYEKFFSYLRNAKLIHDRWEKEYLIGMNFNKADLITNELIDSLITEKLNKVPVESHRFSGAMTPQGQICFYSNLTENIQNRYIIKGRPGTGKSTMTRKIASEALKSGYDVEYYHCSFDPKSIDMIIIPELSFAILDGTAPHVFDPSAGDHLLDMFSCVDTDIVHENDDPIKSIENEYSYEINKAKEAYKKIKQMNDELKQYYINATDFNDVNALRVRIVKTLKDMKKN